MSQPRKRKTKAAPAAPAPAPEEPAPVDEEELPSGAIIVRRMHRRDLNRVWEFLKLSFRDVNRETVEYQRPRSKQRFEEIYEEEGIEQLSSRSRATSSPTPSAPTRSPAPTTGSTRATSRSATCGRCSSTSSPSHPDYHGRGVGSFMLEQLQHLARVHGCTHLVLEVAENNENALHWYRKRNFNKLDAAIFMAQRVDTEPELLPPRELKPADDR